MRMGYACLLATSLFSITPLTVSESEAFTSAAPFDWSMAQEEVMQADLSTNDPIRTAIARLEKQYEEDKHTALEKQRLEYEKQMQHLKNYMSPSTPYPPYMPYDPLRSVSKMTSSASMMSMSRLEKWGQERDEAFKRSLANLRHEIIRANGLAREANFIAEDIGNPTRFSVTLQIPPQNLSPNRRRGNFVSEPAILVKRKGRGNQIWSLEKLDLKLTDMRDVSLQEEDDEGNGAEKGEEHDPFYESTESHNLIGVANVYLGCLFHDVAFDYHTPIISQQGEVTGRLQVQVQRTEGILPDRMNLSQCDVSSETSSSTASSSRYSNGGDDVNGVSADGSHIGVRVTIKQVSGLPPSLSHFVFCQYSLWGSDEVVVPPMVDIDDDEDRLGSVRSRLRLDDDKEISSASFVFSHTREFVVPVTEEFIEHCGEGALSVEVYGHRSSGFANPESVWDAKQQQAKARSLADRQVQISE